MLLIDANKETSPGVLAGYRMPKEDEFLVQMGEQHIYNIPKFTKQFLYRLETYNQKEEYMVNPKSLSIEHIMPQTLSSEWEKVVDKDSNLYPKLLHTIGNLTLTADNSELSNKLFNK